MKNIKQEQLDIIEKWKYKVQDTFSRPSWSNLNEEQIKNICLYLENHVLSESLTKMYIPAEFIDQDKYLDSESTVNLAIKILSKINLKNVDVIAVKCPIFTLDDKTREVKVFAVGAVLNNTILDITYHEIELINKTAELINKLIDNERSIFGHNVKLCLYKIASNFSSFRKSEDDITFQLTSRLCIYSSEAIKDESSSLSEG